MTSVLPSSIETQNETNKPDIKDYPIKCSVSMNSDFYEMLLDYISMSNEIKLNNFTVGGYARYNVKSDLIDEKSIDIPIYIPYDEPVLLENKNKKFIIMRTYQSDTVVGTNLTAVKLAKIQINSKSFDDIKELLIDAKLFDELGVKKDNKNNIDIYVYEKSGSWICTTTQETKKLECLLLDEKIKQEVIDDMEFFIENKEVYKKFGMPYKRTYIITGPPGTGKSSFIYGLASRFNMNIAILKLDGKNSLESAIKRIPKNTILLIEDIEHVFPHKDHDEQTINGLNISDILNTLNGVIVKDKLITFMTANSVLKLPKKLLRPGRVDKNIEFKFCSKYQIEGIFNKFFPDYDKELFYTKVKHIKQITPAVLEQVLFNRLIRDKYNKSGYTDSFMDELEKEVQELINLNKESENHLMMLV